MIGLFGLVLPRHEAGTGVRGRLRRVHIDGKFFEKKYNRSAMENARHLQCKALRELEKSRRRNNNDKQWKKQCAKHSERSEMRMGADVRLDAEHVFAICRPPLVTAPTRLMVRSRARLFERGVSNHAAADALAAHPSAFALRASAGQPSLASRRPSKLACQP
jgi:hypothetical protein